MSLSRFFSTKYLGFHLALYTVFIFILFLMGRVPVCECGSIKFWHGVTESSENSQHISDWYSFSHLIHGFIFFGALTKFFSKTSLKKKLLWATIVEMAWEILENTPYIINRYREATISLDYFGDSIVNSVSDVLWMVLGFWLAKKIPLIWSLVIIVVLEIFVASVIRDNLTLNVIMLIYPHPVILNWQNVGNL